MKKKSFGFQALFLGLGLLLTSLSFSFGAVPMEFKLNCGGIFRVP